MGTSKEQEVERLFESAPIEVDAGEEVSDEVKAKRPGVFLNALKDRSRVIKANLGSVDKVFVDLHCE